LKKDRKGYATRLVAVWVFQISFSFLILDEAFRNGDLEFDKVPDLKIGFTRFIASMVMHVVVSEEIQNGLKMMKYASNHWWKFSNPRLAWLAGFLQMIAMFAIAIINYFVITISNDVLTLAKDFTALLIIADFDDLMSTATATYASNDELADDVQSGAEYEDLLLIEVTTSLDARRRRGRIKLEKDPIYEAINRRRMDNTSVLAEQKSELTRPATIYLSWYDRPFHSLVQFIIYRIFRIFYISFWFYFFPFLVLGAMYMWPVFKSEYGQIQSTSDK